MGHKVQLRGGFADRNGINKINDKVQIDSIDNRTRNYIISVFNSLYVYCCKRKFDSQGKKDFLNGIKLKVYGEPITEYDLLYGNDKSVLSMIEETIMYDILPNVFSLLEYICQSLYEPKSCNTYDIFNDLFEHECVGYRFVNDIIVSITNDEEIKEIEEASNSKYSKVNDHIKKALALFSNRDNPDYENSIKESISAVEAICEIIAGKQCTLGEGLKELEKNGVIIHPAMKKGFEALYGYTSDASGIRHAGGFGNAATLAEAKYMLVSCSAFVNYLIENYK